MTPNPYRNAYDTALAELTDISARFEQLRTRKGQVEHLIAALQSVFGPADASAQEEAVAMESHEMQAVSQTSEPSAEISAEADPPAGYSYLDVPNPLPESDGDPFQRRAKTSFRFRGLAAQRSF